MEYSRRHLIRVGQAVLAVAALPELVFGAGWGESDFRWTQKKFAPLVNDAFLVQSDSGARRWFTLLAIEDMTLKAPAFQVGMLMPRYLKAPPKTETFALRFLSTGETLPQGTHVFEHESTGRLPLFIVPAGNSTYVAIVNVLTRE